MAFRSMTGFGHGEAVTELLRWEVDVSSVNRKQFDARVLLPKGLIVLEARILEELRKVVSRGAITVTCRPGAAGAHGNGMIGINETLAQKYLIRLQALQRKLDLRDENVGLPLLLSLPGVVVSEDSLGDPEMLWPGIRKALLIALKKYSAMRSAEGRRLQKDLQGRVRALQGMVATIQKFAPSVTERHREALKRRLAEAGVDITAVDGPLAREVAIFADRCDITEEIVRLESHFAQYRELEQSKEPAGRSLDFLCQEILREINTIGSKANDERITRQVIDAKSTLESIREQVQNVE